MKLSIKRWRNAFKMVRTAGLALLVTGVQGCIVLPVPQLPSDHVTLIEKEEIELIQAGETRREDIHRQFGSPKHSFGDGSRWLYVAKSHRAGGVRACGGMVDPFSILDSPDPDDWEGIGGCTEKRNTRVVTYLDIEFDITDIVERTQLSTAKKGRCVHSSICLDDDSMLFVYGSVDDEARAKMFQTKPNQCAVFMYTTVSDSAIHIRVDEKEETHRFYSGSGFIRFDLDAGLHQFNVSFVSRKKQKSEAIEIDCAAENAYFIRQQRGRKTGPSFTTVSMTEGKSQILERKLVLVRDGG